MFHVRYFWRDKIIFEIANPEETCAWYADTTENWDEEIVAGYGAGSWRSAGLQVLRRYYRWTSRRRPVKWGMLLACPECKGEIQIGPERVLCPRCAIEFPAAPHPDFSVRTSASDNFNARRRL